MNRIKIIISILTISICISSFSVDVFAEEDEQNKNTEISTLVINNILSAQELLKQARFTNPGGHGFAAEEANNLIDVATGKKVAVIGYDNSAGGADRKLITRSGKTIYIQDKYYSTAQRSVESAFDNSKGGLYKYYNADGTPMQLEVASNQYDESVNLMKNKIKSGKVPGVTNPDEAKNLVRKGHISYDQAVNISKAGTVDSLVYDSTRGCVAARTAFGISATLDFVLRTLNGEQWNQALKNSAMMGLKTGGNAFAIYVITSQLSKTNAFVPTARSLVNTFGDDYAKSLINLYGVNRVTNEGARKAAVNILKNQMISSAVTVFVLTVPDAIDLVRGRISAQQLIKNLAVTTAGVAGGIAGHAIGSAAGSYVVPGVGTAVGGTAGAFVGGAAAGYGAEVLMDMFIEDDAERMIEIIQNVFHEESINYLVTAEEAEQISAQISELLVGDVLKEMFKSKDKELFVKNLIQPLFEKVISERQKIIMPTSAETRKELLKQLEGIVYLH